MTRSTSTGPRLLYKEWWWGGPAGPLWVLKQGGISPNKCGSATVKKKKRNAQRGGEDFGITIAQDA